MLEKPLVPDVGQLGQLNQDAVLHASAAHTGLAAAQEALPLLQEVEVAEQEVDGVAGETQLPHCRHLLPGLVNHDVPKLEVGHAACLTSLQVRM